jgi:hypothetical protein
MFETLLPVSKSVAYIQLFRRYTIVHAGNDLLSNAVGPVNVKFGWRH